MRLDQGSFVAVEDIQRSAWPGIDLDELIAVRVADEIGAAKADKSGAKRQAGKPAAYPCRVAPVKAPQAQRADLPSPMKRAETLRPETKRWK
jgi:hypothetical protein